MRVKDIDIIEFDSILELYDFLENNCLQLERKLDLTDLLIKYRRHTSDDKEKQVAQWELDSFRH